MKKYATYICISIVCNEFVLNQMSNMQLPKKLLNYQTLVLYFYRNIYFIHYIILFCEETK